MTSESLSTANYTAVIDDLRAKRDEIDRAIATLEAIAGTGPPGSLARRLGPSIAVHVSPPPPLGPLAQRAAEIVQARREINEDKPSPTGANGIGEAVARVLQDAEGAALSTREVTDKLIASGFKLDTKNPVNNVWSALSHRTKVSKDVERAGKNWRFAGREKGVVAQADEAAGYVNGANQHTR